MCRWMAYLGEPIRAEDLVFRPVHSIIDQSLHARLTGVTTNGDGFGIGWYADGSVPSVYKTTHPAWNDANLREIAGQITTPLLFAHVRASSGSPVQRSNCHPFRHEGWLWMHNGSLANFKDVRRELLMAVDPALFPGIEGSTDSEALFYLALTFGLREDPPAAVARAVGLVEDIGRRNGVQYPVHMTVATSDGESIWLFRYSSEKAPAPCTSRPMSASCGSCIQNSKSSTNSVSTPASSFPNRCETCRERGARSPTAPGGECAEASRKSNRSRRCTVDAIKCDGRSGGRKTKIDPSAGEDAARQRVRVRSLGRGRSRPKPPAHQQR